LFFALTNPGHLPHFAEFRIGEGGTAVKRLIVDGVLQVLHNGEFVSGPHFVEVLAKSGQDADSSTAEGNACQRRYSIAALQYGQRLVGLSEQDLALRLYCYGRQPISPKLRRWLPNREAVAEYLALVPPGLVQGLRQGGWAQVPDQHWYQWVAPQSLHEGQAEPPGAWQARPAPSYKLYVSPLLRQTDAALRHVVGTICSEPGPTGFKVGAELTGICRPDKLVVYFSSLEELHRVAEILRAQLADLDGCGVPFTAMITNDGMLSWGADPPVRATARGLRGTSWRMWLARRLAHYLLTCRSSGVTSLEPWQFALNRLSLSGVNTTSWTPSVGAWAEILETG
jgi:hypothetical protein